MADRVHTKSMMLLLFYYGSSFRVALYITVVILVVTHASLCSVFCDCKKSTTLSWGAAKRLVRSAGHFDYEREKAHKSVLDTTYLI